MKLSEEEEREDSIKPLGVGMRIALLICAVGICVISIAGIIGLSYLAYLLTLI